MVSFFGDYDTTETVVIPFNTFTSDDPSASATITNLVAGDVEIHKDGGATQRSSDAGVTVSIDFDTVTGNHIVSIDLSDNTDAGFYSAGSRYQVRVEGTTVDGATINAWIGAFSIGCTLRPTTDGRKLDVTATGAAGIDWGNVENPTTAVDLSGTDIQLCDTVTTLTGHTAQTGDSFARIGVAGAGLTNINLPNQTMDITGDITGNLSGSVGSVTGAVGSVTAGVTLANGAHGGAAATLALGGAGGMTADVTGDLSGSVGSVTGAVGSVTGAVGSVTGNVGGDVAGNVDGTVAGVTPAVAGDQMDLVNAPNATAVAAIQSGLSTHGAADVWALSIADGESFSAGTAGDRLRKIKWAVANKMDVTNADGTVVLYKDDGTTAADIGAPTITDDSTTTTREALYGTS